MGLVPKPDLDKIQWCTDKIGELLQEIDKYVEEYEVAVCLTPQETKKIRRKISALTSKLAKYFKPTKDFHAHAKRYEDYIKGQVSLAELEVGSAARADKAYRVDPTYVEANEILAICESLAQTVTKRITQFNKVMDSTSSEFVDIKVTDRAIAWHDEKEDSEDSEDSEDD